MAFNPLAPELSLSITTAQRFDRLCAVLERIADAMEVREGRVLNGMEPIKMAES